MEHDLTNLSDWKPRPAPQRIVMDGRYVRLEPLNAAMHGDGLFEAATDGDAEARFRYLPEFAPSNRAEFQAWLDKVEVSADPMYFVVIDKASGKVAGRQTLMRMDPANGVAEIGHIHWGPLIQKTPATTEALYLFARHLFDELGYRRFEWKCNNENEPSKRAALRYGFKYEGVFRKHLIIKGLNRDTAWFAMTDDDWAVAKPAFETWLSPSNFDDQRKQKRNLASFRTEP
ncbi:MAG: GNAT family N-acetyltransferase [Rhizobiaceae bacterium]